ncbi:MAG: hypothetical protein ACE5GE_12215 [Phycisphaerae bacterium]
MKCLLAVVVVGGLMIGPALAAGEEALGREAKNPASKATVTWLNVPITQFNRQLASWPEELKKVLLKHISDSFAKTYTELEGLTMNVVVAESGKRLTGDWFPLGEVYRLRVKMGRDEKFSSRLYKDEWKTEFWRVVSDGKTVTERNATQQTKPYPWAAYKEGGSIKLSEGIIGCQIGSYLSSWIGEYEVKHSVRPERIATGTYKGLALVEYEGPEGPRAKRCHVIEKLLPGSNVTILLTYYVDVQNSLMCRFDTVQSQPKPAKNEWAHIKRERFYQVQSTDPVSDEVFQAPPAGDRTTVSP